MKIIIVGCGKVGTALAEELADEKHDLTIIDKNAERLHQVTDSIDAMPIVGDGVDHTILMEAGIQDADLIIAVTGSDEKNLLCCVIAKKAGHCKTIARISEPVYNREAEFFRNEFGISMLINPEQEAAEEIYGIFQFPFAERVDSFSKGEVQMFHFKLKKGCPLEGKKISTSSSELKLNLLICIVKRGDDTYIPNGSFVLKEGDVISLVTHRKEAVSVFKKLGMSKNSVSDVIIAGGGDIAFYLASRLIEAKADVTIIEKDRARCEELSTLLPDATIIHGDATNQKLLSEEGIENTGGFASLTGVDEENILLSLHANKVSGAKTVTGVGRSSFNSIINEMNLGSIIYPRLITAHKILRFARAYNTDEDSEVETLYKLSGGKAEALNFRIKADSAFLGIPIMKLGFRKNTLIACIYRNHKVIIPKGHDELMPGDLVLVVISGYSISSIREIFVS